MSIVEIIKPVIYGAVILFLTGWFFFVMYWIVKDTGMLDLILKLLKIKKQPSKEIYREVAEKIIKGKSFTEIMQSATKYDKKVQQQYIEVYLDLTKNNLKGGKK